MSSASSEKKAGRPVSRLLWIYYRALLRTYGPQRWWPARTRFEVIVGAILTQNVSWRNVERAIAALRRASLLDPGRMRRASSARLATLIRPAGFFRQKTRTLRGLLEFLDGRHGGSLPRLLAQPEDRLREELLALRGIGPETADSIVLYAAGRPAFVVDAYTRRILSRHGLLAGDEPYEEVRRLMESALPRDPAIYNEYHALLVRVGKERCLKHHPHCRACPLERYLPGSRSKGRS